MKGTSLSFVIQFLMVVMAASTNNILIPNPKKIFYPNNINSGRTGGEYSYNDKLVLVNSKNAPTSTGRSQYIVKIRFPQNLHETSVYTITNETANVPVSE